MQYVEKTVKLPKELSEAADKIVELVRVIKDESKDGFGVDDIPSIISGAVGAISELSDFAEMENEFKTDSEGSAQVIAYLAAGIGGVLAGK